MLESPLVSIIVLSYRNVQYLNQCLDSIFSQTYNNIEVLISNDGADEFNESDVITYVNSIRADKFNKIMINKNERNLGTVKHCNKAIDMTSGQYIMFIACDDVYNNTNVIYDMVNGFKHVPADTMSIVGQCGMYNEDLSVCEELYVDNDTKKIINEFTPYELYRKHLIHRAVFPAAAVIYKREVFEKYGKFDEKYFLIEDWTSSVFYAKQGMRTYYLDIMCINHRHGGVSHSEINPSSFAQKMYFLDQIILIEDILEDKRSLDRVDVKELQKKHYELKRIYETVFVIPFLKKIDKKTYFLKIVKYKLPDLYSEGVRLTITFPLYKSFIFLTAIYILNYSNLFEGVVSKESFFWVLRPAIYVLLMLLLFKNILKILFKIKTLLRKTILTFRS